MGNARNAIMKALIEGVITELMVKTNVDNVFVDGTTTLAAKLSEIIVALNSKAQGTHTHDQSEVSGLTAALANLATASDLTAAINALRQEMLGNTPVEAYNTFTELAAYIEAHQDAADALTQAIGQKASQTALNELKAVVDGLGALAQKSIISESDLDSSLKEKVNAAAEGNHSHSNKGVLDGITEATVAGWNGKGKIYTQADQPAGLTANDLWVQLV